MTRTAGSEEFSAAWDVGMKHATIVHARILMRVNVVFMRVPWVTDVLVYTFSMGNYQ